MKSRFNSSFPLYRSSFIVGSFDEVGNLETGWRASNAAPFATL
jgi:hypothetical protein